MNRTGRRVCQITWANENDVPGTEVGIALARLLKEQEFKTAGRYRVSVRVEELVVDTHAPDDWQRKAGW